MVDPVAEAAIGGIFRVRFVVVGTIGESQLVGQVVFQFEPESIPAAIVVFHDSLRIVETSGQFVTDVGRSSVDAQGMVMGECRAGRL